MSDLTYETFAALYAEQTQTVDYGSIHDELTDAATVRCLYLIADSLIDDAKKFNLTSITEPAEIIRKHLIDSLIPLSLIVDHVGVPEKLADIGTGAGFPLLPMAAGLAKIAPSSKLLGIDSTAKKISHINAAAKYVGLTNVSAVAGRAEEFGKAGNREYRGNFDLVTARAVANLPVLMELCAPLVRKGGVFAALKSHADEEMLHGDAAAPLLGMTKEAKIDYEIPGGDTRCVIFYRKISDTPEKFPRRYAEITKQPLG